MSHDDLAAWEGFASRRPAPPPSATILTVRLLTTEIKATTSKRTIQRGHHPCLFPRPAVSRSSSSALCQESVTTRAPLLLTCADRW
jgi:hypothetical protein